MSVNLKELREERATITKEMRDVVDAADARENEPGRFTPEEREKFDKMDDRLDELDEMIEAREKVDRRAAKLAESRGLKTEPPAPGGTDPTRTEQRSAGEQVETGMGRYAASFRHMRDAAEYRGGLSPEEQRMIDQVNKRSTVEYRAGFNRYLIDGPQGLSAYQQRAGLQVDLDDKGGFLAPTQFAYDLIAAKDSLTTVRQRATVIPLPGAVSLGVPTLDTDVGNGAWTGEIVSVTEDDSMEFGKRELMPYQLATFVRVSNKLLRVAGLNPEALIRQRLAYKRAAVEENAFLNGTGAKQPLGMMVASNDGIGTARDVSTGNTTTTITADGLINAQAHLKPQYWANASWTFHRLILREIRKLKTSDLQYIWQPGLSGGIPNTILGMPYDVSEWMPYTLTAGLYVGLLGDLSFYWIAESLGISIQKLMELYALTNQTGFIARSEIDGAPTLAEAFVRVKTAAS